MDMGNPMSYCQHGIHWRACTECGKKVVLLTGAAGFVGSHILSHLLQHTNYTIVCICSWKHRGKPQNILNDHNYKKHSDRVRIITHDLISPLTKETKKEIGPVDIILNVASESHVDRSITEPVDFINNNIQLMFTMMEFAKEAKPDIFLQFSTDEVYGQAPTGTDHVEWSPIIPSNPYAASKACQEAIAISYWRTYSVPLIITNTMNIFSSRQDWEKFIPLCVKRITESKEISVHGYPDGKRASSRFYISADNVASGILHIIRNIKPEMYPKFERPVRLNLVGEKEVDNLELALQIGVILEKHVFYKLVDFHSSRPGHDCRYALDGSKLASLGWKPALSFDESLEQTVIELAAKLWHEKES